MSEPTRTSSIAAVLPPRGLWAWAGRILTLVRLDSIRSILVLLLLLILVPMLFAQAGLYYKRVQARQAQEVQSNLEIARMVAATLDTAVADTLHHESSMGIVFTLSQPLSPDAAQRLLEVTVHQYSLIQSFAWVGSDGIVRASSSGIFGENLSDREYFREIRSGRPWAASDLLIGQNGLPATFVIGRGIRDDDGRLLGVVVASLDLERLGSMLRLQRSGQGTISIVDRRGSLVYRYPDGAAPRENRGVADTDSFYQRALAGEETAGRMTDPGGREWISATVPVSSIGWAAGASRPLDEAMGPMRSDLLSETAVLLLVLSVALVLALAFGRRITLPVRSLRESALAVGHGKAVSQVALRGPAELQDLGEAFNRMALDIRAREDQREELLEKIDSQRSLFQAVVDNAPAGIAIFAGGDLHVRFANDAFLRLLGSPHPGEGIVGLHLQSFMPRVEENGMLSLFRQVVSSGEPYHESEFEYSGLARGTVYWRWSLVPLPVQGSEVPDLMMLVTDLTGQVRARKKLEDLAYRIRSTNIQLEAERLRLKAIIDSAPEGVVVVDGEGRTLLANPAADRLYARPAARRQGPLDEGEALLCYPDGTPCGIDDIPLTRSARHGETCVNLEMCILWPGGEQRDLLMNCAPIMDGAGNRNGAVAVFQDVTDMRRMERSQRLLAEASEVLTSSLDYVAAIREVAGLAAAAFGASCIVDLVEGEVIRTVAVMDTDPAREEMLRKALGSFSPSQYELHPTMRVLRSGKSDFYPVVDPETHDPGNGSYPGVRMPFGSALAVPIGARGRVFGTIILGSYGAGRRLDEVDLAVVEDLGRRCGLAVDNALLHQKAQQAIAARDEFLSVASHELRTPMTSLRGFTQLTLRHLDRSETMDAGKVRQALQVIDQQSLKLSNLIAQLLDISRLDAGRLSLDRRAVDLATLVRGVVENIDACSSQHSLVLDVPDSTTILGDPLRLEQVVTNLLDNAIKYSPYGGAIEIRVVLDETGFVRLIVRDHGIGISLEHQEKVFDRFYQANTLGCFGGLGLGLYISHEIVRLHGGRIDVESPADGGTRFVVSLPCGFSQQHRGTETGARNGELVTNEAVSGTFEDGRG